MELKKFIQTVKMQRGRYAKTPDVAKEKGAIEKIVDKFGGKLEVIAQLKEAKENDMLDYIKGILGIKKVKAEPKEETPTDAPASETPAEKKKVGRPKKEDTPTEYGQDKEGNMYTIDTVKKTCKKVYKDLKDLKFEDLDIPEMSLKTYYKYLKDKFAGEDIKFKKDKITFRDFRISLSIETGFTVEDIRKKGEIVETPFEGIPTPKELGEWFKKPVIVTTPEEEREAIERGKEFERRRKAEREAEAAERERMLESPTAADYEKMRRHVLKKIGDIRKKADPKFDPHEFPMMIPFKRWRRQANSLLTKWKKKEIRYAKFLKELERVTTEETFVIEEKNHRSSFKGSMLPGFRKVGYLIGNQLEVDDKRVDAVPFLLDYLLHYEPRAMSQIMKYSRGEITDRELIENPIVVDWKEEYKKRGVINSAHNAQVITCVFDACGLVAPQDLLYEADLKVGDVILLMIDGELRRRTIAKVHQGIEVGKEVGLLKTDKWIKAPIKETEK